jgi:transketolase
MTDGPSTYRTKVTPGLLLRVRRRLLQMHFEAGVGHIGGNLSCLDILLTLYHDVLGGDDTFVLSKGHAAGALYVALWSIGALDDSDLRQFHGEATLLGGHPPFRGIQQIPFATGSLGHGLGLAAGVALGQKLKGRAGRVFCLTSDGEWNEGSSWEALIFIKHRRLDNVTLIVDLNGMQGFGNTREIADLTPLKEKFQAFGFHTVDVDGHSPAGIADVLSGCGAAQRVVIANTRKGHGVAFMQDRFEWHYLPMTETQYREAVIGLSDTCAMHSAEHS